MNSSAEDRLLRATLEYQAALDAGQQPERAVFLQRYPDLAAELVPYLEALDALRQAAPPAPATASPADLPANAPLGDFQIVRQIGRGGMGVVYEAIQLSLGRRVALKVLPFAAALDDRQLARFKTEAQAAAGLHHGHIVPVFAVGCDRGVHFYAMQLINGRTLAQVIAELRQQVPLSAGAVTVETTAARAETVGQATSMGQGSAFYGSVARLMVQAAEALEHAHQQGVIHRDVKPANLLLDARGCLWVTDFGLAQVQASVELTRTGDLLGTLRYMSPEQTSGQRTLLDHRADLYALGATFYELLTLEPIFPGTNRAELLRQITTDEPRVPRTIRKTIPTELETILLKCLSKSPADRYSNAQELADDLGRFLDHRPILARRPSLAERGRKWMRRHPAVVGGAGLVFLLCTVGLLISNALVSREKDRTREAMRQEQIRADQAERRLKQTRQLVDMLIQIGEEELDDSPFLQGLRKQLLETALAHYQLLIDDSGNDASAPVAELSAARERVRQILADLVALQGGDYLFFLGNDAVLEELRVQPEQRQRLREMLGRLHRERMEMFFTSNRTPAMKKQQQLEQARAANKAATSILTPAQRKRLNQVALQSKGSRAFRDPEIVVALRLTPVQRKNIREIEAEAFGRFFEPPGRPGGPKKPDANWLRDLNQRCTALLTPEQKAKWQELAGDPFTLPPPSFNPPRPFGPPPGGS